MNDQRHQTSYDTLVCGYANAGSQGTHFSYKYVPVRKSLLVSQNNRKLSNGQWSGGGPFFQFTDEWVLQSDFRQSLEGWDYTTSSWVPFETYGVVSSLPSTPKFGVPYEFNHFAGFLQSDYTRGFARTRPGNPEASLAQFVGELKDLPSLPLKLLKRLKTFQALGSEYLNVQFGWVPFVRDVQQMVRTFQQKDAILRKLIRQNKQNIHRRAKLTDTSSTTSTVQTNKTSPFAYLTGGMNSFTSGTGRLTTTTTKSTKSWYSASYRYYIIDPTSPEWARKASRILMGANITPALVWELLPWSWLADWFTNVGDVISNLSENAIDNLVCNYSFIMATDEIRTEYLAECQYSKYGVLVRGPAGTVSSSCTHTVRYKMRKGGLNPYGLGFSIGSLSGYQQGILAALGISRQTLL